MHLSLHYQATLLATGVNAVGQNEYLLASASRAIAGQSSNGFIVSRV